MIHRTFKKKHQKALWVQLPGQQVTIAKPRKRVRQRSRRMVTEMKIYQGLRQVFLYQNRKCAKCGKPSTEVHHFNGRGRNLLKVGTFVAICSPCHRWVHENPAAARDAGLLAQPGAWR